MVCGGVAIFVFDYWFVVGSAWICIVGMTGCFY